MEDGGVCPSLVRIISIPYSLPDEDGPYLELSWAGHRVKSAIRMDSQRTGGESFLLHWPAERWVGQ